MEFYYLPIPEIFHNGEGISSSLAPQKTMSTGSPYIQDPESRLYPFVFLYPPLQDHAQ